MTTLPLTGDQRSGYPERLYRLFGGRITGIGQIGDAVSQMDQVRQQDGALVEASAAAASALEQQAQATASAVAALRLATS